MPASRNSPGLRKRQLTPEPNGAKAALHASAAAVKGSPSTRTRLLLALISLSVSAFFILRRSSPPASQIPDAYALCSPDGDNIYTVDEAVPRAQCLVVKDEIFVGVGSLGECANCT